MNLTNHEILHEMRELIDGIIMQQKNWLNNPTDWDNVNKKRLEKNIYQMDALRDKLTVLIEGYV